VNVIDHPGVVVDAHGDGSRPRILDAGVVEDPVDGAVIPEVIVAHVCLMRRAVS